MASGGPTFTVRAILVGIAAMVLLGVWSHAHEVLAPHPAMLGENSPPAGAVAVFIGVMALFWGLARYRESLRLMRGELVVVYAMLVISAPLMTQGMWHRLVGLIVAIPHNTDNLPLVDRFSDKLWPHGEHLIQNRRFENLPLGTLPLQTFSDGKLSISWEGAGKAEVVAEELSQVGATQGIRLRSVDAASTPRTSAVRAPLPSDSDVAPAAELPPVAQTLPAAGIVPLTDATTLRFHISRSDQEGRELIAGERYYITALLKVSRLGPASRVSLEVISDGGERVPVTSLQRDTSAAYSRPGGFLRTGQPYIPLPRDMREGVDLALTLSGPGEVVVTDVVMFSNEALARMHKGSDEVVESESQLIPENSRDSLFVRPDNLWTPAGVWYIVKGYIPHRQWAQPLMYWMSIVLAMVMGLLGMGVIFRKQWTERERLSFPMTVLPRLLLDSTSHETGKSIDSDGTPSWGLMKKPMFRVGFVMASLYAFSLGLAHYVPGLPEPRVSIDMASYVSSPAVKSALWAHNGGNVFELHLLFIAVAFFVDLEILLSLVVFFWLAKAPFVLGEIFGWKSIRGIVAVSGFPFPHEQHIGAFLTLAGIAIWTARDHLKGVFRRVLGMKGGADDSGEAMNYRLAVASILFAFIAFGYWGRMTGLGATNAVMFFGFLMVCGLAAARIRVESGAPFGYFTPYFPYLIFFLLGGLVNFRLETMILAFVAGGFMAAAQFLMIAPTQIEMLHLAATERVNPRGMTGALLFGVAGGVLVGGYVLLTWCYGRGGENIPHIKYWVLNQNWYLQPLRQAVADADTIAIRSAATGVAESADYRTGPIAAVGVGSGITLVLTYLRIRFAGFWLHPLGYVLANTGFIASVWGSLLVAWIVKFSALKLGGPRLIRESLTPLFAGLFVGGLAGIIYWDVVAAAVLLAGGSDVYTCWP